MVETDQEKNLESLWTKEITMIRRRGKMDSTDPVLCCELWDNCVWKECHLWSLIVIGEMESEAKPRWNSIEW